MLAPKVSVSTASEPAEEAFVDLLDHVGPSLEQDLGAVFLAEVVLFKVEFGVLVDRSAHAAVKQQDAFLELFEEFTHGLGHPVGGQAVGVNRLGLRVRVDFSCCRVTFPVPQPWG